MEKQLLNFKTFLLVFLMTMLGGVNSFAAEVLNGSWNLTKVSADWTATGNEKYFNQPYGFKKANGTLVSKSIDDFSKEGISQIKVGFKCLQNNGNTSEITIYLVDGNGKAIGEGQVVTPVNANAASKTTYQYATFTSGLAEAKGFMMKVTKFGKNILVNGAEYEITLNNSVKTLTSLVISGEPTKKVYNAGEALDPTGLVVTGTYDDETTAEISSGITWTMNPETLSAGNTSCTVTATVNGVTSDSYEVTGLTVTKSRNVTFNFTANPNVWNITPINKNGKKEDNVVAGKELAVDDVVMTATNGSQFGTCLFLSSGKVDLRVYGGGSITFTAPEGYNISKVDFTGEKLAAFSANVGDYSNAMWTGDAHAVTFSASATCRVSTATITLVEAEPQVATSGTLTFKAQDTDKLWYATFSSEKDVVFTSDVVVYGVSVSNDKLSLNALGNADYDVTDTSVGYNTGIVEKGYYVPANNGVLVISLNGTTPFYFPKEVQNVSLPENMLKPAPVGGGIFTSEEGYKYYKLAYNDYYAKTGLGFYWGAKEAGAFQVKAGLAYMAVPAAVANNAKGFRFDGVTDGIDGVSMDSNKAQVIYNINGQRVANMSKAGLYIVNGKKVVVK